jgi:hypothetical protein
MGANAVHITVGRTHTAHHSGEHMQCTSQRGAHSAHQSGEHIAVYIRVESTWQCTTEWGAHTVHIRVGSTWQCTSQWGAVAVHNRVGSTHSAHHSGEHMSVHITVGSTCHCTSQRGAHAVYITQGSTHSAHHSGDHTQCTSVGAHDSVHHSGNTPHITVGSTQQHTSQCPGSIQTERGKLYNYIPVTYFQQPCLHPPHYLSIMPLSCDSISWLIH